MMETKYICHVWAELEVLVNKLQLTLVHTSLVILVKKTAVRNEDKPGDG